MDSIYHDQEYMNIVYDILESEEFSKLKEYKHHGMNRFDHSLKVSYYSYLVSKKLKLNYIATARGGLLHDFFSKENMTTKKQKFSAIFHPYVALHNSCKTFSVSDMEKDIIINHMFPILPHKVPKYMESWIVSAVDKAIATNEFYNAYGKVFMYRLSNLYLISLIFR